MTEAVVTIINKLGLHARAASKFVATASKFASDVELHKNGQVVNGKSIMGVLMLAAPKDTELILKVTGKDETEAIEKLQELVANRFGEEE